MAATEARRRLAGGGNVAVRVVPDFAGEHIANVSAPMCLICWAATALLGKIQLGAIRVTRVESNKPSPFAASLLFSYIANYIYEGDAPLAERRAQALSFDQSQLQELLGDTDLRELLDPAALDEVVAKLQALDPDYQARHADGIHDLLLKLGDLTDEELAARVALVDGRGAAGSRRW